MRAGKDEDRLICICQQHLLIIPLRTRVEADRRAREQVFDAEAAHETIDILSLLKEKTAGNLTPEEEDFFEAHLGDLKLAYVQRTKNIG